MATIATMAMLKPGARIVSRSSSSSKAPMSMSLRSLPHTKSAAAAASSVMAGAFFSALASTDAAVAAQQIADVAASSADAGSDSRGTLLLAVVAPAIGWVLYNILQPALNQLNRMRGSQGVVAAGLGGAAGLLLACAPEASAATAAQDLVASVAAAAAPAGDDNRGTLLLLVVAPAIAWVLYNILQPALNQLNRMRKD